MRQRTATLRNKKARLEQIQLNVRYFDSSGLPGSARSVWMYTHDDDFEVITMENVPNGLYQLQLMFQFLASADIDFRQLKHEHILLRRGCILHNWALQDPVEYFLRNMRITHVWPGTSCELTWDELWGFTENFAVWLPRKGPRRSEREGTGYYHCREFHWGSKDVCNAPFRSAIELDRHLGQTHRLHDLVDGGFLVENEFERDEAR
ncbi:hypothetical protein MMC28_002883 [Mycoblastus sanguinarius]|nr:hypothetical protein [Mycoblastus sanguinarius]